MSFVEPTIGERTDWRALNGALLIIDVEEAVKAVPTKFGTSDAVRATITVVDGDHAEAIYSDTLVFPRMLQAALRDKVGKKVLGRLGQGTAKDPSMDPPWILETAGPDDIKKAEALVAKQSAPAFADASTEPF